MLQFACSFLIVKFLDVIAFSLIDMDISQLCRSCMRELSVWEIENCNSNIAEMFYYCTNIKVSEDDKLPKQFCTDCVIKIESTYNYILDAQKVDITLRNIVSRTNTSVIVEPDNYNKNFNDVQYTESIIITEELIPSFTDQIILEAVPSVIDQHYEFTHTNFEQCKEVEEQLPVLPPFNEINNTEPVKEPAPVKETIDETKKNVCPVCRKSFMSKTWFSKHMEKVHTGPKHVCHLCQKSFSKPSQLNYHLPSHSDERKFGCTTCGKRFKLNKQLLLHARSHSDNKPYACDKCTMRFKKRGVLRCHMRIHDAEKQYLCSFCGWGFAQAGNLAVHMRSHTGEKPFACSQCSFRAAAASNLRRHERAHTHAASYVCRTCRKGFYDASSLARHTRTHSGERPYACPRCARTFMDSWKRKVHLMRAHSLALADIPRMDRRGNVLPADDTRGPGVVATVQV